ncbi:MAG: GNAT family N-acetyltransferase [Burkholderiales bacterium]
MADYARVGSLESLDIVESLSGVEPEDWNRLAGSNPFVRHEFLSALIDTGCASARTGWVPRFLLLRRSGALAGAMPLFLKSHSYGEYVFDWAWADAYARHGLEYYPKLLGAVPFTPVSGPRLLAASEREREALLGAALELARDSSSLHVLFPTEDEARLMQRQGMLLRRTVQFHWRNEGYADFEAFLARLTHARRKNIRQERRRVREAGVTLRWLRGAEIERRHWELFHQGYCGTYAAHRSSPYLNLEFFLRIGATLPEHILMILAERGGAPIACSLCLVDAEAVYGRYWGALEHVPLLHFECCYYQAIEYAIANGLKYFEGGAQGEHKLFRGLMPVETVSAHWLAHPAFARAIEDYLERETSGIGRYVNELNEHTPFRQG